MAHNTGNARGQMGDYIKAITTNKEIKTIFVNEGVRGIGVMLKKR